MRVSPESNALPWNLDSHSCSIISTRHVQVPKTIKNRFHLRWWREAERSKWVHEGPPMDIPYSHDMASVLSGLKVITDPWIL